MAHDYDPAQDYEIDAAPRADVSALVAAFTREHAQIIDALGLAQPPTIHFVTGLSRDHLARYVNGTASAPVVVLDASAVAAAAAEHGVRLPDAVESTLLHEYGHAFVDSILAELDDEEEAVEAFARTAWGGDWRAAVSDLMAACNFEPQPRRRRGRLI